MNVVQKEVGQLLIFKRWGNMLVLKGDRQWGSTGDQEDLEAAWTPSYPNVQAAGPQVSLVKFPQHLSALSPPPPFLPSSTPILSCETSTPTLQFTPYRADGSKFFCGSPPITRENAKLLSMTFFPCLCTLPTSQPTVQSDQENPDMAPETHLPLFCLHRSCSFFSYNKLL